MTLASTSPAARSADAAEVTVVETVGRGPLLLLAGSALCWLLLSGLLALIGMVQLLHPAFLAGCSIFTYGRTAAMSESAFIYGWIGNAGLAVALWMMGRLSGEPLRAPHWITAGAGFWNFGLLAALIGIAIGYGTATPFFQLPAATVPILLVAHGAMAVPGVLAWAGRRRDLMFASQWYGIAAFFLFPWIAVAAYVLLDVTPVQGVLQGIVAGWFAQSLWTCWMAPLALAGAYYVVPRVTGRVLPAYDAALLGFWLLLLVGGFSGGRHLIGGPVPAWISSVAIVSTFILLVHYIIVALNLRGAFGGGGTALRFIAFGLAAYLLGGVLDAVTAVRSVAAVTQFTFFDVAQTQLALYGGVSLMLFGALYFALPRALGRPWASAGLIRGHWLLTVVGLVVMVGCLAGAGLAQGHDLNDATVGFATIAEHYRPWLLGAAAGGACLFLGSVLVTVNLFVTTAATVREEIFPA